MKNSWFSQLIHTLRLGLGEDSTIVASAPAVPVRDIFRRFWPYARPYRGAFACTLVFVVLVPAVEALTIWMYKVLVDDVLIPGNFDLLLWVVLAYLALTLLEGFVSFGDDYLGAWVGEHFVMSLRTSFFRHLQGLSLHFFDSKQLGDVLTRLTKDVGAVEGLVLSGVAAALSYGAQLIIYTGVLFYLQWKLALVSLIVTPLFWFLARYFSSRIKRVAREERRRSGSVSAVAEESLANAMLVQAYNRQDAEVGRFHRESEGSFRAHLAATRLEALFSPLVNLTEVAGVLTVILVGSYELAQGRFTIGGLLVFLVYLGQLYGPIRGFSSLLNRVHSASAGAERILEFLDEKPAVQEKPDARTLTRARGTLSFESVTFRYPGAPRDALHDLSFSIGPGETLALVGASGAGKSTLAKLLVRFGDPGAGRICLDGYDLRELKLHSLRENVTLLLQETLVFDGTVRDNLLYGKPDASESEILSAAKAADAHDFIVALPEGYDTVIGQRGRLLSGGQRQRLAIARAMIRDAPVLVLDEPTTGLDAASSRRVLEPLRRLMAGRTVLIISHNLLTVQDATRILVLEGGRVAETGDHATLLANEGVYAHYYRLHGTHHDRYDTPTA